MTPKKLKEIQDILNGNHVDDIPKGWYSRSQLSVILKVSLPQTDRKIKAMLDKGILRRELFCVNTISGIRKLPYFFIDYVKAKQLEKIPSKHRRGHSPCRRTRACFSRHCKYP